MLIDNSLETVKPFLSKHVILSIWQLNIFRIKVFSFLLLSVEPKVIKTTYIPSSGGDLWKHVSDHDLSWLNPSTDFPTVSG